MYIFLNLNDFDWFTYFVRENFMGTFRLKFSLMHVINLGTCSSSVHASTDTFPSPFDVVNSFFFLGRPQLCFFFNTFILLSSPFYVVTIFVMLSPSLFSNPLLSTNNIFIAITLHHAFSFSFALHYINDHAFHVPFPFPSITTVKKNICTHNIDHKINPTTQHMQAIFQQHPLHHKYEKNYNKNTLLLLLFYQ